jgi:hypothetical protein
MQLYNLTGTSKGEEIELSYWESPEPKREYYKNFERYAANKFGDAYDKWLESKKTVMVHSHYRYDFKEEFFLLKPIGVNFTELLQKGIPCDSLASRVEIKKSCLYSNCDRDECNYAILKPVVDVIEESPMTELFKKYGHLLPNCEDEFIKKEKEYLDKLTIKK